MLAGVTLGSVRSADHAARVAEQFLLAARRPLLVQSRIDDPLQKISFSDDIGLSPVRRATRARPTMPSTSPSPSATSAPGSRFSTASHLLPKIQLRTDMTPTGLKGLAMLPAHNLSIAPGRRRVLGEAPSVTPRAPAYRGGPPPGGKRAAADDRRHPLQRASRPARGRRPLPFSHRGRINDDMHWFRGCSRRWNVDRPQPRER